jgi:hypothetical protein
MTTVAALSKQLRDKIIEEKQKIPETRPDLEHCLYELTHDSEMSLVTRDKIWNYESELARLTGIINKFNETIEFCNQVNAKIEKIIPEIKRWTKDPIDRLHKLIDSSKIALFPDQNWVYENELAKLNSIGKEINQTIESMRNNTVILSSCQSSITHNNKNNDDNNDDECSRAWQNPQVTA